MTGRAGEGAAAAFLEQMGYRILERNLRFRAGELDLVAEHDGVLVFVEVKTRVGSRWGSAAEAITPRKQQQLVRLARIYLSGRDTGSLCRFDVVTVALLPGGGWQCALIANAFGG